MAGFDHKGALKRVITWGAGIESWDEYVTNNRGGNRNCQGQLIALAKRLADFGKLRSPDQMNAEGDGVYAIKARCGLRAYGWFETDPEYGVCFIIGRLVMKKKGGLDPKDREKVVDCRKKFQGRGAKT